MKPLLRGHFHQAMFFITMGACLPLIMRAEGSSEILSIIIYTICALILFGVSAIYHRVNWSPKKRLFWRKLDHCGIYLMIAGTCTPIALLGLNGVSARNILMTIWGVAFIGILQSIFFVNIPKILSASIYLVAGYLVLPYLAELKMTIGLSNIRFIILGGMAYSLGALFYGLKRPILNPKVFSYHEIFHLLVNIGAVFHFIVINSLVS